MYRELEIQQAIERFQQMRLIDNALMNIAFKDNIPAVEYVVQIILGRKDIKVVDVTTQQFQALPNNNRSAIFDIVAKDKNGRIFNVEMQTNPGNACAKRARYHCSLIDSEALHTGEDYSDLHESYVIFITDGPFLGMRDVPIETFIRKGEKTGKVFDDAQTIVYVNAKCQTGNDELSQLMRDLTSRHAEEISSKVLQKAVEYAKGQKGVDMYIEGYDPNQDEIIRRTIFSNTRENILSCFQSGFSIEQLSRGFKKSTEEITQILAENQN